MGRRRRGVATRAWRACLRWRRGADLLLFGGGEAELLASGETPALAYSLHVFGGFLVLVVLLNLLIAILSDSYERIQDRAQMELFLAQASYVDALDRSLLHYAVLLLYAVGLELGYQLSLIHI